MKTLYNLLIVAFLFGAVSCSEVSEKVTQADDYNSFLETQENEMLQLLKDDFNFWEEKLEKEPNQFPYLAKAATSQSQLFKETGNIEELIGAERKLIEANEKTNYTKVGYLRALARNYISQHKFKESLKLLKKAETIGENLNGTQKMLFDVYLELGNVQEAETYLEKIENFKDFDYLIRVSKWSDHNGNLDHAILYLEKATQMAEASNDKWLKQWAYTNLADYYGHDGQIAKSYQHYLKSLELNPNDAYAKKGIAWIVYSHERNPKEALRILDAISQKHKAPDYYLLKAEIAEYMGNTEAKEQNLQAYFEEVQNKQYGNMYNKYNAIILAEDTKQTANALKIATTEIKNRPTPQSYDLLAWTYYNQGDSAEALKIMENHVVGKTFEPEALYHLAHIYKANGKHNEAKKLKKELLESAFELGPIAEKSITNI